MSPATVALRLNTSSLSGFTGNTEHGFHILAFPCNQFGNQKPDANDYIEKTCRINYGTTFPMFAKVDVNGDNSEPLFAYLKSSCPGLFGSQAIKQALG